MHQATVRKARLKVSRPSPLASTRRTATRGPSRLVRQDLPIAHAADLFAAALPSMLSNRGRLFSRETVRGYVTHLSVFVRWCGERPLSDLSPSLVNEYVGGLWRQGQSAWTVGTREKVVRLFVAWLVDRKMIAADPLAGMRRVKAQDTAIVRFTGEQIATLLAGCDRSTWGGTRDTAILLVLLRTGVRAAELCDLDMGDYDREAKTLRVRHGKGDKPRTVGVPDEARAAVEDWLYVMRTERDGPLFPSERGHRLSTSGLRQMLERLERKTGVQPVHAHRFRHTFAVQALKNGMDIYTLSRILGHATIAMSARYLRALQEEEAAEMHARIFNQRGRR